MNLVLKFYGIRKSLVIAIINVFFFCSPSYANSNDDFYIGFNYGVSFSNIGQNQSITNLDVLQNVWLYDYYNLNDGWKISSLFSLSAGYGFFLANNFSIDCGVALYAGSPNSANGRVDLTLGGETAHINNYSYNILSTQLMAEVKIRYKDRRLSPFILVGIGASWNKVKDYSSQYVDVDDSWQTLPFKANQRASFAYEIGLGLDYQIYREGYFGLVYRYAYLGDMHFGIKSEAFSHELNVGKIATNSILLGFTYRFK